MWKALNGMAQSKVLEPVLAAPLLNKCLPRKTITVLLLIRQDWTCE